LPKSRNERSTVTRRCGHECLRQPIYCELPQRRRVLRGLVACCGVCCPSVPHGSDGGPPTWPADRALTNPADRFPDDVWQPLLDAVAEYVRAFIAAMQSDGSDIAARMHHLVETCAMVNRTMRVGPILLKHSELIAGSEPVQPADPTDPAAMAQYHDALARWVMEAWQLKCEVFLKLFMSNDSTLNALHNDTERGLAGDALRFFRPVTPKHGNKHDVLQFVAKDAFVYSVILAAAELDGAARIQRVLDDAGIGITTRGFTGMRQTVADKAALDRIVAEAKRRQDNRLGRQSAPRPMAPELIAGSITEAERLAINPEQYIDLASLASAEARIRHLFSIW
jgi:hypothetical protein